MNKAYLALCFNFSVSQVDDGQWLPMIPSGLFTGRDGRTWNNSDPDGVVNAFDAKLPFDVEHATEIKGPQGEEAPACGWITELENRDGEIWGKVEWNQSGRWRIEDKHYCYYSPAFAFDETGKVTAMSSAGLTNKPNLHVPALNSEDNSMPLKAILAALNLSEDSTPEQAVVAINTMKSDRDVALNRSVTPDLNKFVPKETYDIALNRASTAEEKLAAIDTQNIEALVDSAVQAGKVAPANKAMYVSLCRSEEGREQFKAFVDTAPSVVEAKKPAVQDPSSVATNGKLDQHEIAICRKMGISNEDFLKQKQALAEKDGK